MDESKPVFENMRHPGVESVQILVSNGDSRAQIERIDERFEASGC